MKRSKIFGYIAPLIFLIAFNAIFFIVGGTDHPVSVWMAYGVIHFSYLMTVFTPFFVKSGKNAFETGAPLATLSLANFIIHFLLGLLIFLISPEGHTFVLVMYIILLAIYFILFFSLMSVNAHTDASAARQASEVSYIKSAASRVKMLIGRTPDTALNKQIERVYDNLHSSPTRSNAAVASLESTIVIKVGELESAIRTSDTATANAIVNELLYLIDERTRLIQINY